MRQLLFAPRARDDFEDLWFTVARGSGSTVADTWLDRVHVRCVGLLAAPAGGRPRDELIPGMRSAVVRPWVVFYRVSDDTIEIVRVLHGRRDAAAIL